MRDELRDQVAQLEREALVMTDEREKLNDDLAGVQAERDLLERKVNGHPATWPAMRAFVHVAVHACMHAGERASAHGPPSLHGR